MGMDLIPRNANVEPYHLNWTGWKILGDLLESLNQDLSQMKGSNDGDLIDEASCFVWADAITAGLKNDLIRTRFVKDSLYQGGGYHTFCRLGDSITQNQQEWLMRFVDFLMGCGGCEQH